MVQSERYAGVSRFPADDGLRVNARESRDRHERMPQVVQANAGRQPCPLRRHLELFLQGADSYRCAERRNLPLALSLYSVYNGRLIDVLSFLSVLSFRDRALRHEAVENLSHGHWLVYLDAVVNRLPKRGHIVSRVPISLYMSRPISALFCHPYAALDGAASFLRISRYSKRP